MSNVVHPFTLAVPDSALADLRRRLEATRWPEKEPVSDWSQGVPLANLQALVDYWLTKYDWRRCEAMLNKFGQFKTEIDGLGIHFLHLRSPNANALPLVLSHGWPGSVIEFHKVLGPLTDPAAYGGDPADAFHVVAPSLPGFGFSDKPAETGWKVQRIGKAWHALMTRLGYTRYVAQGGDWGSVVTTAMGVQRPKGLEAIHVNLPLVMPEGPFENLTPAENDMLQSMLFYDAWDSGYSKQQSTCPQTIGYSLADSPTGLAGWIFEKFWRWTDCAGDPLNALSYDELIDNLMLYWLPNNGASSARIYWESFVGGLGAVELHIPTGVSVFPKEIYRAPRSWADRCMHNIIHWNELERGGHFAAFEQPDLFVQEVRDCFRQVR